MKKHDNESNKSDPVNPNKSTDPRRNLLKKLALGGVAGAALPAQWSKPVIDSVILPAHAQTTTGNIVGGGGGGGAVGASESPDSNSVLDFFVQPAHAGTVPNDYCLEISVQVNGGVVTAVSVTKLCWNACKPGTRWWNRNISATALSGSGSNWMGTVGGFQLVLTNVDPNAAVLANSEYDGISGVIHASVTCDCSCEK